VPVAGSTLQKMAVESYKPVGTAVDGWELFHQTPTLKFYKKGNVIVVAVRGTEYTTTMDVRSWAPAYLGQIATSERFKKDLAEIQSVQRSFPPLEFEWYGVGHSLGGAIIDELLEMGVLREGLSYNPAVAKANYTKDLKNERLYVRSDPLYELMGKHTKGVKVREPTITSEKLVDALVPEDKSWKKALKMAGKVYDKYSAHKLSNFEGGRKKRT